MAPVGQQREAGDHAMPGRPLESASIALAACWQEIAEQVGADAVSVSGMQIGNVTTDDAQGDAGPPGGSTVSTGLEGRAESTWQPRSYGVQTDLSGGITGAQASLYAYAQHALDQSLALLDGLYALNPAADTADVAANRGVVSAQLADLLNELGYLGGPRVERVDQCFSLLLGTYTPGSSPHDPPVLETSDADRIEGSLGKLRDLYAIYSGGPTPGLPESAGPNPYINSVADERDTSNFRIIADYVTFLAQSWSENYYSFGPNTTQPLLGTQCVLISRQFSAVAHDVSEVRFALDSVFIGPAERQSLQINLGGNALMFFEDYAHWIQDFASSEGPQLLQHYGVGKAAPSVLQVATLLQGYTERCIDNPTHAGLPKIFETGRVQQAMKQARRRSGHAGQLRAAVAGSRMRAKSVS